MEEESKPDADDERPPICPACGVTMGIIVDEDGATRYVCLECGFSDETKVEPDVTVNGNGNGVWRTRRIHPRTAGRRRLKISRLCER